MNKKKLLIIIILSVFCVGMALGSVNAVSASKTITCYGYKTTITDSQWNQVKNGEKEITKKVGYKYYKVNVPVYKYKTVAKKVAIKKCKAYTSSGRYLFTAKVYKNHLSISSATDIRVKAWLKGYKGTVYLKQCYKTTYKKVKYIHHYKKVNKKYNVYMKIFRVFEAGQYPIGIWADLWSKEPLGCKKLG